jgi:hypothetical protein
MKTIETALCVGYTEATERSPTDGGDISTCHCRHSCERSGQPNWAAFGRKRWYSLGICLEGLRKTTKPPVSVVDVPAELESGSYRYVR